MPSGVVNALSCVRSFPSGFGMYLILRCLVDGIASTTSPITLEPIGISTSVPLARIGEVISMENFCPCLVFELIVSFILPSKCDPTGMTTCFPCIERGAR